MAEQGIQTFVSPRMATFSEKKLRTDAKTVFTIVRIKGVPTLQILCGVLIFPSLKGCKRTRRKYTTMMTGSMSNICLRKARQTLELG